ncbi:MAG TPA: knotted carbamoyltransferase YgeW [Spirochaetia bacterium]|nr:knotted carbamoyltransferase YgeW [Spirochaetia bacterium]
MPVITAHDIQRLIDSLAPKALSALRGKDFLLTWDKSRDELEAIFRCAEILRALRISGISARVWDSGLAVSQFRDNSTRTRFSFASACNLLGLTVSDLDEGKSQIAHGETVRETSNMISFMADVIGIRDDMFIGKGHTYMQAVAEAVDQGFRDGVLEQRPTVVNLQCDIDHPTQSMSDLLHLVTKLGGVEKLKGKKVAMTWAYSPSYGKPLSVPQGVIGLFTRFGMDVRLAYPEGYSLMPDVVKKAEQFARESGGGFHICASMAEAFDGAQVVYPKSWAPFSVMEERTAIVETGDRKKLDELEKRCLQNNARFRDWECTEKLMEKTRDALYLHCLPADISGVSCDRGEVAASVFDRFRTPLYRQAGWKPYIIAAMIFASRISDPRKTFSALLDQAQSRLM